MILHPIKTYLLILGAGLLFMQSCTKGFDSLNQDPTKPT